MTYPIGMGQGPRLYWGRTREREYAEREAAGERLWTRDVPAEVRNKIFYAFMRACAGPEEGQRALSLARDRVLWETGWLTLGSEGTPAEDFCRALEQAREPLFPTLVEALAWTVVGSEVIANPACFVAAVNDAFRQHRVSWELIEGQMVPFDSNELHTEVVEPVLRLLSRSGWEDAEAAYQKALRQLSEEQPDTAITAAGSALQETLTLLGCAGSTLDQLGKSGLSRGVLAPYDKKLVDWLEADRSNRGDAHRGASGASRDDAWLAVHVAGALIRRLGEHTARSQ